jgi:DNA-binding CsgD family transcriptional regulator
VNASDSEPAQRPTRRTPTRALKDQTKQIEQKAARERASKQAVQQAVQEAGDDLREQVWTLHLRGLSMRQIALRLDLNRKTVARLVNECYREFGAERRARLKHKLDGAVAHMRHIQTQAWDDHDADDGGQKSAHLRVALDAEKEVARLEGLYADDVSDLAAVLFSVERVVGGVVVRRQGQQGTLAVGSAVADENVAEAADEETSDE